MSGQSMNLETAESRIISWEVESNGAARYCSRGGLRRADSADLVGCSLKLRGYLCGMPFSFDLSRTPDELVSLPEANAMAFLEALEQALHPKKIRERAAQTAKRDELDRLEKRAA